MSNNIYIHIPIKGDGNCMYYTVAHFLMYFLRAQDENKIKNLATHFFSLLDLKNNEKKTLHRFILSAKKEKRPFTQIEIDSVNRILGPACRNTAAKSVLDEFKAKPKASPITTAANHIMLDICTQIADHPQNKGKTGSLTGIRKHKKMINRDYNDAEINKIKEIKDDLIPFLKNKMKNTDFLQDYEKMLAERLKEDEKNLKTTRLSEEKLRFIKEQVLSDFLLPYTVEFFEEKNYQNLMLYVNRLRENRRWGSEETLLSLFRYLSVEKAVKTKQGTEFHASVELPFTIIRNFELQYDRQINVPFYIHNSRSTHWDLFFRYQEERDNLTAFQGKVWRLNSFHQLINPSRKFFPFYHHGSFYTELSLNDSSRKLNSNLHKRATEKDSFNTGRVKNNKTAKEIIPFKPDVKQELILLCSISTSFIAIVVGATLLGACFSNPVMMPIGAVILGLAVIGLIFSFYKLYAYNKSQCDIEIPLTEQQQIEALAEQGLLKEDSFDEFDFENGPEYQQIPDPSSLAASSTDTTAAPMEIFPIDIDDFHEYQQIRDSSGIAASSTGITPPPMEIYPLDEKNNLLTYSSSEEDMFDEFNEIPADQITRRHSF